jgi:hypothetical protein
MDYLLGFNEPWDTHESSYDWKYIAPADAAKYWGEYYIPTAKALNLKLGTPTTIINFNKIDWMVEFIQACWELRDADENPSCRIYRGIQHASLYLLLPRLL